MGRGTRQRGLVLVAAAGLALLAGCTVGGPKPCYKWVPHPVYMDVPKERVVTDNIRGALDEAAYDTLAVYPFNVVEYDSIGARSCVDRVEHWLVARHEFDVVSRQHVETVLYEEDIADTGRFNPETVATIGRLVGAKAVVVGSLYGSAPEPSWSLQIIDAETGQIAWGTDGTGLLEDQIDDTLGPLVDREIRRTESYIAQEVERVDMVRTQMPCPDSD